MKRIGFQLGIALVTFCSGVAASWFVLLISQPPGIIVEPPFLSETIIRPMLQTPPAVPSKPATVVFRRSYTNRYGVILAEFKVTNISDEPLYYVADVSNANWNRYYYIRRGSELEESDRTCGTGLMGYTLSPGGL
jgi:hypothetical protein